MAVATHTAATTTATGATAGLTGATKGLSAALNGLKTAFLTNPLMQKVEHSIGRTHIPHMSSKMGIRIIGTLQAMNKEKET